MRFPKIDDVAAELRNINKQDTDDVRLQVYPDGDWAVRWGSSDYDQDHRGYWGASSVPGGNRRFDSKDVARELIDRAKDQHAQGEEGLEEAPVRAARAQESNEVSEESDEHPDVDFAVDDASGREHVFKTFDEAAGFALSMAASGVEANLDILIHSEEGAEWYGGDDAVEQYNEDPEASIFERLEITVNNVGRIS